jgi:nucleotide-binding universal stress UspA family protein
MRPRDGRIEMARSSPVVVGYDGSGRALAALKWAAREATDRGLPLRVIRAIPYAAASAAVPALTSVEGAIKEDQVLDEGIRVASTLMDADQVRGVSILGHPAGVLADASAHAALVVVGQRSQDAPVSSAVGSTSLVLADRVHCPVAVARGALGPERSLLPIVVGVTDDAGSRAALDFAAQTAQIRDVPLTVVAAWSLPPAREWARGAQGVDTVAQLARELRAQASVVAEASERWVRHHYPLVATRTYVEQSDAATALRIASHRAGLLVVGGRKDDGSSLGGRDGEAWGQVAKEVLGGAACPVVVVPLRVPTSDEARVATLDVEVN